MSPSVESDFTVETLFYLLERETPDSEIEEHLQTLQSVGALTPSERMSLQDIVESKSEAEIEAAVKLSTTEEILKEYQDAQEDEDPESESELLPTPTPQEAMKAMSILFRYIEDNDCVEAEECDVPLHELERLIAKGIFVSYSKQTSISEFLKPE